MMMTIGTGAAIRARREELGLSIQDFEGRVGLPAWQLDQMESGGCHSEIAWLADVADELGVCPGWLLYNGKCPRGYIPEAGGDAAGETP